LCVEISHITGNFWVCPSNLRAFPSMPCPFGAFKQRVEIPTHSHIIFSKSHCTHTVEILHPQSLAPLACSAPWFQSLFHLFKGFCVSRVRCRRIVVFRYRQREMERPSTDGVRKTGSIAPELIFWDVNKAMASRTRI
jgi:hypothetical protein